MKKELTKTMKEIKSQFKLLDTNYEQEWEIKPSDVYFDILFKECLDETYMNKVVYACHINDVRYFLRSSPIHTDTIRISIF